MVEEHQNTDAFRGAAFHNVDLNGALFTACDMRNVTIRGSWVGDFRVSGHAGELGTVIVNDVDVTEYVRAELDRRYPELAQMRALREAGSADELRTMWDRIETLWSESLTRAEGLAEQARQERVAGEFSFVETMRHLVFATDVWVERMIGGKADCFHQLGLPPSGYSKEGSRALGLEADAQPSYETARAALRDAMRRMRDTVTSVTDAQLDDTRTAAPAPEWDEETETVRHCLYVVVEEFCQHRRFAERDLAILEAQVG